jgi:hypothetical protein
MRTAKTIGLSLVLLALSGAAASSASAGRLLTFYANGEQIPIGPKFSDPFELTTTGPVTISIPSTKVSITCPSEPFTATFGWFESNGQTEDIVGTNGYYAGPVRECSGMIFGGLLLDGTLHFRSNGRVLMGANESLEHSPEFELNSCRFVGALKSTAQWPGLLSVTLQGKMRSQQAGCPPLAKITVGPLEGLYESHQVEGRITP